MEKFLVELVAVWARTVALRDKQIPAMLLSQKQKISVFCLYQFKVGLSQNVLTVFIKD